MSQLRTVIVGCSFHLGGCEAIQRLAAGEELMLARQPDNPYDKNTVAVLNSDWQFMGFIPRSDAPLAARVLDLGLPTKATAIYARNNHVLIEWETNDERQD